MQLSFYYNAMHRITLSCLLSLSLLFVLTSCGSAKRKFEFEQDLNAYNDMVRWHNLDEASCFAGDASSREFLARVKAAKDLKVVDYRILEIKYDEVRNEAEVRVEMEYYLLSSNTLKRSIDIQKWGYVNENGVNRWKLMSLFPEFR